MLPQVALLVVITFLAQPAPGGRLAGPDQPSWPQWGGPTRDFKVEAPGIGWTGQAPRRAWQRELGDGFTGVVGDRSTIYTGYRRGGGVAYTAIEAATGRARWETVVDDALLPDMFLSYGSGPNSTPALGATRLFAVTFTGRLVSLDLATGRVLWTRELWRELKGTFRDVGYSNSPMLVGDLVVVPVGGRGRALAAFRQADGTTAWIGGDLENAMSSPILVEVGGDAQIVALMVEGVAGFDPRTGRQLWFHPHRTDYDVNSATPVWHAESGTLVVSSAYGSGTRAIRLSRDGGQTRASEAWFTRRLRVHHGNMLVIGGHVYGSSGDFGPAPMTALDIASGEVAWQSRAFPKATLLGAGDRTIVLDEDGRLAVTAMTPRGVTVLQEAQIGSRLSWTAPTMIGRRLYVRDRKMLVALDLDVTT